MKPGRIVNRLSWLGYCGATFVPIVFCLSCAPRTPHEKSIAQPSDYRRLAWQIMEDVATLKHQLPCLAELDLTDHSAETFQPLRLQMTYVYGNIEVANARWMPDDPSPRTIQHFTREGVFFSLSLTLEAQVYQQSIAANRIGQLSILLDTKGPKAHQVRSAIAQIVSKHRSRFAQTFRL